MVSFSEAVQKPFTVETMNGAVAYNYCGNNIVELFYNIGAARNDSAIIEKFAKAFGENKTLAARVLFWARDVREGAGERDTFRKIMLFLEQSNPTVCQYLIPFIAEYGRFDDLLIFKTDTCKYTSYTEIQKALKNNNSLAAKWCPRKGEIAVELRKFLKMSPKQYRKTLVNLTSVVEQDMCAGNWDNIDYNKLPSIAAKKYTNAFNKHSGIKYGEYIQSLINGTGKVNAAAIFPHDVIKGLSNGNVELSVAQWNSLPNFLGNDKILPMIDVSGSMSERISNTLSCMDISISLGLYIADKQSGPFKDLFLTFSEKCKIEKLTGDIANKVAQLHAADWGQNTNFELAYKEILKVAIQNNVDNSDMPKYLLVLSDMQFDDADCENVEDKTMFELLGAEFKKYGYDVPKIIFWNLNSSYRNTPVKSTDENVVLISGFSSSIMKHVLKCEKFSPNDLVLEVLESPRYNVINVGD